MKNILENLAKSILVIRLEKTLLNYVLLGGKQNL